MKKLILLLLFIPLISCTSSDDTDPIINNDNSDNNDPPIPRQIKFTLHELWKPTLKFKTNTRRVNLCKDGTQWVTEPEINSQWTGFEVSAGHHYSLDTLIVEIHQSANKFDFKITNRGGIRPAPKRIGHIKIIRLMGNEIDEKTKLYLHQSRMKYGQYGGVHFPVKYFTSNVSEDLLEKITIDLASGPANNNCQNIKFFEKVDTTDSFRETTETTTTVIFDSKNNNLKVGDKIGRTQYSDVQLGEGWGSWANNSYMIVKKELIY